MKWCRSCVLPDTRPNLMIGADGICSACASHGTKRVIDWEAREQAFRKVVTHARGRSRGYDCVIPVSGGKDSTWQVVTCLEYGLNPLCVTWRPPGRTEIGQRNLDNLIGLGVDHIDYSISPAVEKAFMLRTLERVGSPAVPMHMAIFNIPVTVAVRFGIPLIVWGENSAFEYGGADEESRGFQLDRGWFAKYGVTHGTTARDWIDDGLTERMLTPYFGPGEEALEAAGISAVFLGYYFEWDAARTAQVAARHGFSTGAGKVRTGLYDFADIDDDFISVHHWFKWYKFGFTRAFDNASLEIRNGRLTREQAVALLAERGDDTPKEDIAQLCRFLGIDEARFFAIAERFRNPAIWRRGADGVFRIEDFLIEDWTWA